MNAILGISLDRFVWKEIQNVLYKTVQASRNFFVPIWNGRDHKPNMLGHPKSEHVWISSPHCRLHLNSKLIWKVNFYLFGIQIVAIWMVQTIWILTTVKISLTDCHLVTIFSVDLVCKVELNLMLVNWSRCGGCIKSLHTEPSVVKLKVFF